MVDTGQQSEKALPEAQMAGTQPTGGDSAAFGCLGVAALIFVGGLLLWLARPASWGIPGFVCFIIMALGWTGLSVTWKDAFKGRRAYLCPHCGTDCIVREDVAGKAECAKCKGSFSIPMTGQ